MDEGFAAVARGPASTFPRGYVYLIPIWFGAAGGALWYGWKHFGGTMMPRWYGGLALGGLVITAVTMVSVLGTVRHLAFRADDNGIRLGVRTARKRPRQRQAHLWWTDVRQLVIVHRRYGLLLDITIGPAARIVRRRNPLRQALLMCGMLILPVGLGRGTPRLTEPRGSAPQYRVRLCDVTAEELGLALAPLAPPEVEIIVMSRRRGMRLARRPPPAAQSAA